MEIIMRKVSELTPYEKNAKTHDKVQIDNVAQSIKELGWLQPIVVDRDGVVVVGHCRLLAAKKLKQKEVPCVIADDLTDEQIKKYRVLDNKLNESPWDLHLLAEDIEGLDFSGYEVDFGIGETATWFDQRDRWDDSTDGEDDEYMEFLDKFEQKKQLMESVVAVLQRKYGEKVLTLNMRDQYYNMRKMVEPHPHVIAKAEQAMRQADVEPKIKPIRGGTDGAQLSFKGLPCPNIFAGGLNFHGRYEFVPIPSMEKASQVIVEIARLVAERG